MKLPAPDRYDTAGDGPDGKRICQSASGTSISAHPTPSSEGEKK